MWPVLAAVALALVVAWRARYGLSFFDDGHYASLTLRLSQGARPFTDEMTAQTLGFLIPAVFAKAWRAAFGMNGFVLALRVLYVAFAAVVGTVVYRNLRPSYPPFASFLAASAPLIALPYNIIGMSYNTTAMLMFLLSWALVFRAVRDGDRRPAVLAGVAAAVGAISHPPLVLGALALLGTCVAFKAARRYALPALLGGAATFALFAVWLLSVTSVADARAALAYSSQVLEAAAGSQGRVVGVIFTFGASLVTPWLVPMWAAVIVASLPRLRSETRRLAALLIPLTAMVPSIVAFALPPLSTGAPRFGALGAAYLLVLAFGLFVPVLMWTRREGGADARLAMTLAVPLSAVNTLAAAYFTSASRHWAVPVIGLAPLLAVLLAGWFRMCVEESSAHPADDRGTPERAGLEAASSVTGTLVIGALVVLLYATAFKDATPLSLQWRPDAPAVRGIITQEEMARRISEIEEANGRWVEPGDGVLFVHGQLGYVLVDGPAVTNAVWLATGPSDVETIDYFERIGQWPDIVFVSSSLLRSLDETPEGISNDPLLSYIDAEYEWVGEAGAFAVYRRR